MLQKNYKITGHMVVKNEDRWVWFSIKSVIDFLDKLIIFDTGSKDHTKDIIRDLLKNEEYSKKIIYKEFNSVSPDLFYKIRQEQIDITDTDYFMIVDGDEIWYEDSLEELNDIINQKHPALVATKFINCCGDIFHYRNYDRETYNIKGNIGSITIRVYSKMIPGIHCSGEYGVEGFVDESGIPVQEAGYDIEIMQGKFFHTSLLNRSSLQNGDYSIKYRRSKLRADYDGQFDKDFIYPEVFYLSEFPEHVKSPFKRDINFYRILYKYLRKMKNFVIK